MDSVKRYPVLSAILALCVLAFAVEAFFVWRFSSQVAVVQRGMDSARAAAESLEANSPAPTAANKAAALKNVDDLQAALDKVTNTLSNTPIKITNIPANGSDLLVAVQSYVTNLRAKAKARKIILPSPDFDFGMSMYIGPVPPPPADKIPAVYTQMKILDYILGHLMGDAKLDNQEMMIVSVKRENVAAPTSSSPLLSASPELGDDIFVIPSTITARGPGIDTLAFQIQFISYTDSLRTLLTDLKSFEMPLVVRSVDVTPADESTLQAAANGGNVPTLSAAERARAAKAAPTVRKPVVSQNLSQFTLVIEYIQLPQPPAAAAPAGTDAPAGTATTSN